MRRVYTFMHFSVSFALYRSLQQKKTFFSSLLCTYAEPDETMRKMRIQKFWQKS